MSPALPNSTASIPAALRAAYIQARQNQAASDPAFGAQRSGPAAFSVANPAHGLSASLDSQGLFLRHATRPAVSLTLQHYGCASSPRLASPTAPVLGSDRRIEYPHDGVREWYLNGPLGLEHGFTLDHDPGCDPGGQLAFSLLLGGDLTASLTGQGSATRLELRDLHDPIATKSPPLLLYSDLFAVDADGRELPSRMRLVGQTVRLEVDAAGARYPVTVDPMWTQQSILVSSDGAGGDRFGFAVAVDGDTAIFGASRKKVGTNSGQGQAYVFVRSGTSWSQQAILVDSTTGAASDYFGNSVALSGDTAVIGAPNKKVGVNARQGQAYVFVRSGTSWSKQAILVDSATGADSDSFGTSVALSGDTAVIGAPNKKVGAIDQQGQAYVFVRSGTSWTQQSILVDSAAGESQDAFGFSVAVSGDTVVIGVPYKKIGAQDLQGLAHVFVRSGVLWSQQAILVDAATGAIGDWFGSSVAVDGDTVVIGAKGKKVGARDLQGQVYVFVRSGISFDLQTTLVDSLPGPVADRFGSSVAVSGDVIVIGVPTKAVGTKSQQGQAYIFVRSGTSFTPQVLVDSLTGAAMDYFGGSVAVSGDTVVIGADGKSVSAKLQQGQVYVFAKAASPNGTPCTLGSQCASTFCVDAVCCDLTCGGGGSSDCQSCLGAQTGRVDGACGTITAWVNYTCRTAEKSCDKPEFCDGLSDSCPPDQVYQLADFHLCRAATFCSRESYCDGRSDYCPLSLCLPPAL